MPVPAFRPYGNTVAFAATTTSTATPLQVPPSTGVPKYNEPGRNTYVISNSTTQAVFVAAGPSNVVAAIPVAGTPANGFYVGGSSAITVTVETNSYFAVITPTGTSTVYITPGE